MENLSPVIDLSGRRKADGPPINTIGLPGQAGFGVGVCPEQYLPAGMTPMSGYSDKMSPNYGNYQFQDGSIMVWVPKFYYRLHASKNITAATKANPCQLTVVGHGLATGTLIFICNVGGMTQLNNLFFTVTVVDVDNVTLQGIDSSAYGTFTSGGQIVPEVGTVLPFNPTLPTHGLNSISVRGTSFFASTATANANGFALHRAFIDGGVEQPGVFVDKFKASKKAWGTGFIASSIQHGNPISTSSAHNPIAELTAATLGNIFASATDAAKARDGINGAKNSTSKFFCCSKFIHAALALLSLAHGQASQTDTYCAWYNATTNFPKGCNSGALKDASDAAVTYTGDGYQTCGKTGSSVVFSKTTHNGQDCGIADLNGLMYEVSLGITCIAAAKTVTGASQANPCVITIAGHGYATGDVVMLTSLGGMTQLNDKLYKVTVLTADTFSLDSINSTGYTAFTSGGNCTKGTFHVAKQATRMRDFTSGNTLATDHWGATGVAAMMDTLDAATVASMFKTTGGEAFAQRYGSGANQVLDESLSGAGWTKTCLGLVKSEAGINTSGTNLFGQDYYYQYIRNDLCALSCGGWGVGSAAGVWCLNLSTNRATSYDTVGFRCACYPL